MLPGDGPPSIGKRDFFVVTGKRKDNAECANTWHFILFSGEKKNKKAERWIHQVRPYYLSIGVHWLWVSNHQLFDFFGIILRRTTIDLFASPFKFLANLSPEDCVPHNHVGHGIYFVDLIKGGRLSRNKYKHHVLDSRQKMWLEWVRYSPVLSARGHSTALILSNEFGDCNRNLKLIVSQWRTVRAGYKNNIVRKWFLFLFFLTDFDLIFF